VSTESKIATVSDPGTRFRGIEIRFQPGKSHIASGLHVGVEVGVIVPVIVGVKVGWVVGDVVAVVGGVFVVVGGVGGVAGIRFIVGTTRVSPGFIVICCCQSLKNGCFMRRV